MYCAGLEWPESEHFDVHYFLFALLKGARELVLGVGRFVVLLARGICTPRGLRPRLVSIPFRFTFNVKSSIRIPAKCFNGGEWVCEWERDVQYERPRLAEAEIGRASLYCQMHGCSCISDFKLHVIVWIVLYGMLCCPSRFQPRPTLLPRLSHFMIIKSG